MAKKLNKNLVIVLSLAGFALIIVLSVLMIMQLKKTDPERNRQMAEAHYEQGDLRTAIRLYGMAWQNGNDERDLVRQGELLLEFGDERRAMQAWNMARTSNPALVEAYEKPIELDLRRARLSRDNVTWSRVLEVSSKLKEQDTANALAHNATGLALIGLKDRDERI